MCVRVGKIKWGFASFSVIIYALEEVTDQAIPLSIPKKSSPIFWWLSLQYNYLYNWWCGEILLDELYVVIETRMGNHICNIKN